MPSNLGFDFSFSRDRIGRQRTDSEPFRILIVGDFSGRGSSATAGEPDPGRRSIYSIDVDNFDSVLNRIAPSISLSPTFEPLRFRRLDDFHPDQLRSDVPELRRLIELRRSLDDPATAQEVMAVLGLDLPAETETDTPAPREEPTDTLIERLLGQAPAPEHRPGASMIDELVRETVKPHVQQAADSKHAALSTGLERLLSEATRRLLHGRGFRDLEALWRATWWLVSGLETGESLSVHILDVSRKELAEDLAAGNADPDTCLLGRALTAHGAGQMGSDSWSLIAGDYSIRAQIGDLKLLALLGATAGQAGAPFLAGADESLLGCRSIAESPDPSQWNAHDDAFEAAWQALRSSAIAPWIGLALPRVLLRLPYGQSTDPITAFAFEEAVSPADPASLLWGSPAIGCALLLGRAFQDSAWEMAPDDCLELDDLPAYTYRSEGESRLTPVAEHYLNDRQAEAILARGIMPFISHRQYNLARLLRFQSIADPVTALSGPWTGG